VFARTQEVDDAEEALGCALLASIAGTQKRVSTADVVDALMAQYGLIKDEFSVHKHRPEEFLIYFGSHHVRARVLKDEIVQTPFFRLEVKEWSRRAHATAGGLAVHADFEVEGFPANTWSLAAAEAILAPHAWVERLHPLTRSRADMTVFRMSAWVLDLAALPREIDFHVVEPDGPPAAEVLASPSVHVVPPRVKTLVYPLLLHVTRTVDYGRPSPSRPAGGMDLDSGPGRAQDFPESRFSYTTGVPDAHAGAGNGRVDTLAPAPVGRAGVRSLSSGVVVGAPLSRREKKRLKQKAKRSEKRRDLARRAAAQKGGAAAVVTAQLDGLHEEATAGKTVLQDETRAPSSALQSPPLRTEEPQSGGRVATPQRSQEPACVVPQPPSPSCPLSPVLAVPSQGQLEIGDDGDTQCSAGASALVGQWIKRVRTELDVFLGWALGRRCVRRVWAS
jgi:hypothetical protein